MKYRKLKLALAEALLYRFDDVEADEIDAIVTHWIHASGTTVPFMSSSMKETCFKVFLQQRQGSAAELAKEMTLAYLPSFAIDWGNVPFPPPIRPQFKFIDLFAGIGGFRIAMQRAGGRCVFSSEWDPYAKLTYEANFGEVPYGDIRKIQAQDIPDHDVLCAGFPCQPFSLAGVSARTALNTAHGFACETQGTLFFDIIRIVQEKRPRVLFLENVKNLVSHDGGRTFKIIQDSITNLGYSFSYQIIDSSPLVPQRRLRCYIVCIDSKAEFKFPEITGAPQPLKLILEKNPDPSFTISDKLWEGHKNRTSRNLERGTGFTAFCADLNKPSNTIVARYGKDGKECLVPQEGQNPRMLTPRECARLQGFPEEFIIATAKTTAYRQFGNSVAVPVIERIAQYIAQHLSSDTAEEVLCNLA